MLNSRTSLAGLAVAAFTLQGCANTAPPAHHLPIYATDLIGKAASCTVAPIKVTDGQDNAATMTTGGGGWCGIAVNKDGSPYSAGLLTQPPRDGNVYVHTVGDDTRIDYTPNPGGTGPDAFAVRLIPGNATVRVAVTRAPAGK